MADSGSDSESDSEIRRNPHISHLGKRPSTINDAEYRYRVDTTFPEYTPRFIKIPTVIVMVGLPARGKTYISKKLGRYLNWIGISTKVVNVGMYRRKIVGPDMKHDFFKPDNAEAQAIRRECALAALVDACKWLEKEGQAVIYDATNTTRERRKMILDYCYGKGLKVFFVESICEDPAIVNANVKEVKLFGPDYCDTDKDVAVKDFLTRIEHYKAVYETLSYEEEGDLSFLKIINVGQQYLINMVNGYLQARAVFYLMNIHVMKRSIYLTRHGESQFNVEGRIGGNPGLSPRGDEYSRELAKYMELQNIPNLKVWTSQMQATVQTSKHIPATVEQWKALNELCGGNCDGMTYEEIQETYPEEYDARINDKFNYRYPRGESYKDLIARLEPVILELERQKNVLVVCHQAVIRCLLAYFLDHSPEEVPHLRVPLHTVFKLTPIAFGCRVEKIPFNVGAVDTHLSVPRDKRSRSVSPIPEEPVTFLDSEKPGPSHLY